VAIISRDLNGDGRLDLAIANRRPHSVTVALAGATGFSDITEHFLRKGPTEGVAPETIAAGNVAIPLDDAMAHDPPDDYLDLVTFNPLSNDISILKGRGAGRFEETPLNVPRNRFASINRDLALQLGLDPGLFPETVSSSKFTPRTVSHGHFNDDNADGQRGPGDYLDLATSDGASGDVSILYGIGGGHFQPEVRIRAGTSPVFTAFGHLNDDDYIDMLVEDDTADAALILQGGENGFALAKSYPVGNRPETATIADVNGDGKMDILVSNRNGDSFSVLLQRDDLTEFCQAGQVDGVDSPRSTIAVGKFNADDFADVAITSNNNDKVVVFLGTGTGYENLKDNQCNAEAMFNDPQYYETGANPRAVVTGQFNSNDRFLDLAVVNSDDSTVSILLGDGNGGFTKQPDDLVVGVDPEFLATEDFNRDRLLDLVTANDNSRDVSILLGTGGIDGQKLFQDQMAIFVGSDPKHLTLGDFDGDGRLDLAVTNVSEDTVSVLLQNPAPEPFGFRPRMTQQLTEYPGTIVTADFNNDGLTDIAKASRVFDDVGVLLTARDGSTEFADRFSGSIRQTPIARDLTGDGLVDVVQIARNGDVLARMGRRDSQGRAAFEPPLVVNVQNPARDVAAVRTRLGVQLAMIDRQPQLNSASAVVRLFDPQGSLRGELRVDPSQLAASAPTHIAAADLTGDGMDELVLVGGSTGRLVVYRQTAGGSFEQHGQSYALLPGTAEILLVEVDPRGSAGIDIVATNHESGDVSVLVNMGQGYFGPTIRYATGVIGALSDDTSLSAPFGAARLAIGQMNDDNGDGRIGPDDFPDLAVAHTLANAFSVLLGKGHGAFTAAETYLSAHDVKDLSIADIDGDGKPDMVALSHLDDLVQWWPGKGNGKFDLESNPARSPAAGDSPTGLFTIDLYADGLPEAFVSNANGDLRILPNEARGAFGVASFRARTKVELDIQDFNGDSLADVVLSNQHQDRVTVEFAVPQGGFRGSQPFVGVAAPGAAKAIDLDRDGDDDLVVASRESNELFVYFNRGQGVFADEPDQMYSTGTEPVDVAFADLNGDVFPDLAVANHGSNDVTFLLSHTSEGRWDGLENGIRLPTGRGPLGVEFVDVNSDGQGDLVVSHQIADIAVWHGKGGGFFEPNPDRWEIEAALADEARIAGLEAFVVRTDGGIAHVDLSQRGLAPQALQTNVPLRARLLEAFDIEADGTPELFVAQESDIVILRAATASQYHVFGRLSDPILSRPADMRFVGDGGMSGKLYAADEDESVSVFSVLLDAGLDHGGRFIDVRPALFTVAFAFASFENPLNGQDRLTAEEDGLGELDYGALRQLYYGVLFLAVTVVDVVSETLGGEVLDDVVYVMARSLGLDFTSDDVRQAAAVAFGRFTVEGQFAILAECLSHQREAPALADGSSPPSAPRAAVVELIGEVFRNVGKEFSDWLIPSTIGLVRASAADFRSVARAIVPRGNVAAGSSGRPPEAAELGVDAALFDNESHPIAWWLAATLTVGGTSGLLWSARRVRGSAPTARQRIQESATAR
jgi:hypothetical protein